jgi:hypothetical protein
LLELEKALGLHLEILNDSMVAIIVNKKTDFLFIENEKIWWSFQYYFDLKNHFFEMSKFECKVSV